MLEFTTQIFKNFFVENCCRNQWGFFIQKVVARTEHLLMDPPLAAVINSGYLVPGAEAVPVAAADESHGLQHGREGGAGPPLPPTT